MEGDASARYSRLHTPVETGTAPYSWGRCVACSKPEKAARTFLQKEHLYYTIKFIEIDDESLNFFRLRIIDTECIDRDGGNFLRLYRLVVIACFDACDAVHHVETLGDQAKRGVLSV